MLQKIKDFNMSILGNNYACTVPCSQYSVLMDNHIIDDVYYGENEKKYLHISKQECVFTAFFDIEPQIFNSQFVELKLYGLDTIAKIELNDICLGNVDNMHICWKYDIKKYAKLTNNQLKITFASPVYEAEKYYQQYKFPKQAYALDGFTCLRKMFCSFGWDWGPQLPEIGIYRDVVIEGYSSTQIDNVSVSQKHKQNNVELTVSINTNFEKSNTIYVYNVIDPYGEVIYTCKTSHKNCVFNIKNPLLWWVRGYGEQNLYQIKVDAFVEETLVDTKTTKIGLRTLTVSTEKDKFGNEFCFINNGVKIFAMGGNMIPMDGIISRIKPDNYKKIVDDCIFANFNTIRVWGGGYYPDDVFYELCDENGIVVWQDFMFAIYFDRRLDSHYQQIITQEISQQVIRLRNHACLGLFCGNNEMEEAFVHWGIPDYKDIKQDYLNLFEKIIPQIVSDLCDVFYWRSSPSTNGGFILPKSEESGDTHFWDVWGGQQPLENYRKHESRFCSEFGHEAYPSVKTLQMFCPREYLNPFSHIMDAHQKYSNGNGNMVSFMQKWYSYPLSIEAFVYYSQLVQAKAIKIAVEHFRANKKRCSGALYWQINDNWPTASWASVDYYGRYKALHYYAKRFFNPILLSAVNKNGIVSLNISSELTSRFVGKVKWKLVKLLQI